MTGGGTVGEGVTRTVVVADDHDFTAMGLSVSLDAAPGLTVIGRAADGLEAISLIKRLRPDCAVLDLKMPGASGLEVMLEGRRWSPGTRFVVLTGSSAPGAFRDLIRAGVDGLFVKGMAAADVRDGVARAAAGTRTISPEAQRVADEAGDAPTLTARETEVLHAVAAGLGNAAIAERLGVSARTVDAHRMRLLRKMDVNSTAALLMRALRDGLIDAPSHDDG